ncbi:unnamed protein product [Symbiodinium natans]|uniref:Uncharacterized protein n=1 Tax=Symbiodinium natans TaxID=878477 RepID=A0A812R1J6_9DINO|nr:unnamed protein product [Symbiodinium natans]
MEDTPPTLAGDELDVRAIQVWAASQEQVAEEVKRNFGAPIWWKDDVQKAVQNSPRAEGETPSVSAIAVARLACVMSTPSTTLMSRWSEDQEKLVSDPGVSKEVCRLSEDLLHARTERREAYRRLEDLQHRKQAAQAALAKAMEMEEETEEDELEDCHSIAPSENLSEHGEEQVKQRGWRGAKRMLGKGLKKIRVGRKTKSDSLTPPSATSPVSSVASGTRTCSRASALRSKAHIAEHVVRTLSPQKQRAWSITTELIVAFNRCRALSCLRPPTPKQLMVQDCTR